MFMTNELSEIVILSKLNEKAEITVYNGKPVVAVRGVLMPYHVFCTRILNIINSSNPQIDEYLNKAYKEIIELWDLHPPTEYKKIQELEQKRFDKSYYNQNQDKITSIVNTAVSELLVLKLKNRDNLREFIIDLENRYEEIYNLCLDN